MHHSNFTYRIRRSAFTALAVSFVVFTPATVAFAQTPSVPASSSMSLSQMEAMVSSLLAMVQSLTQQIADLVAKQHGTVTSVSASVSNAGNLDAVITNGVITPSSFRLVAGDSKNKSLLIHASDADYPFQITESGIDMIIRKGAKVEILLGTLGAGAHVFSCGAVCTGTINIESEDDGDESLN